MRLKLIEKTRRERISIILRPIPVDDLILHPPLQVKDPNQPFGPPEAQFFEKILRLTQMKHPYFVSIFLCIFGINFIWVSFKNWLYPATPLRVAGFEILSWLFKPLFFAPIVEIIHPILIPAMAKLLELLIKFAISSNFIV